MNVIRAGLPFVRSHLAGLALANNGSDANNDIDIAVGEAVDSTNARLMQLTGALTKRIDASWVVGTNQGGLDGTESSAGTPDTSTWYHVYLIMRVDTGVVDVIFSESASAPTLPTNYTLYRRIGSVYNDGSGNIKAFHQYGDQFEWDVMPQDVNVSNQGTSAISYTLSVPTGLKLPVRILGLAFSSSVQAAIAIYSEGQDGTQALNIADYTAPNATDPGAGFTVVMCNTSAQIRAKGNDVNLTLFIVTKGWIDRRGRDD